MKPLFLVIAFLSGCFQFAHAHTVKIKNATASHVTFVKYNEYGNYKHYPVSPGAATEIDFQSPYLNIQALENDKNVPYFFFPGDEVSISAVIDNFYQFSSTNVQRSNELRLSGEIFRLLSEALTLHVQPEELLRSAGVKINALISHEKTSSRFRELISEYYRYDLLGRQIRENAAKKREVNYDQFWKSDYDQYLQAYILAFRTYAITYLPAIHGKNTLLANYERRFTGMHREVALYSAMQMAYYRDKEWFRQQYGQYAALSKDPKFYDKLAYFKINDDFAGNADKVMLMAPGRDAVTMKSVLAELNGKVVLLDLWASWCVPCLDQIPYSKQLESGFEKMPFKVLYLNMDREMHLFTEASDKYLPGKLNYNLLTNFSSKFAAVHKVKAIPRYMLIDKQGNFINTETPFPSDMALKKLIEGYL